MEIEILLTVSESSKIEKAKPIESVYCALCQKPMKEVIFPNAVKNWYECEQDHHSIIVYLSEDERRIGKEAERKRLIEKIGATLHDLMDQEDKELFEGLRGKALDTRWKIDSLKWVLKLLQESAL